MEDYLKNIKELEKNLEKKVEKVEIEGFERVEESQEIFNGLKELQLIIEKAKNICTTPHEEKYLRLYLSNSGKLRSRYSSVKKAYDERSMKKELMGGSEDTLETTAIDILLKEGQSLDNSLGITQAVLQSAQDVKMSLAYQKEKTLKTSDKIVKIVEMVPGISVLISKVSRRKRFNAIVIGITLFICMLITIIYLF